jgi:Na+:H+ antiporter, NhaA family
LLESTCGQLRKIVDALSSSPLVIQFTSTLRSSHAPTAVVTRTHSRAAAFILNNSLLLLAGTAAAVVWANVDVETYETAANALRFWVNDVGMVFFFALAAKEVFEATLPGGALTSSRRALAPMIAAVGGMAAPAAIYVTLVSTLGPRSLMRGWAIPCATDIAFSAMAARLIFPAAHPAIPFLLLLAIADDALGLGILAIFYTTGGVSLVRLFGLVAAAVALAVWLRRRRTRNFWPYVIGPGSLSWAGLYLGGVHPALALVPIVPLMPHSASDLGLFNPVKELWPDALNRFEHWWSLPVQFILFFFGLANGGVALERIGPGTYYVLAALLVGKPAGILLFTLGARFAGVRLAEGLRVADLLVLGSVASIGFTVSLFFATAAFPEGAALAQTKMGALFSLAAIPIAFGIARAMGIRRS